MIARIIELVKRYQHGLFIGVALLLVTGIGYNTGRMWAFYKPPSIANQTAIVYNKTTTTKAPVNIKVTQPSVTPADPRVVASKAAGSKLYHHPWCSGAQRIKETNKLWFPTEADAITAGYTLAANCQ